MSRAAVGAESDQNLGADAADSECKISAWLGNWNSIEFSIRIRQCFSVRDVQDFTRIGELGMAKLRQFSPRLRPATATRLSDRKTNYVRLDAARLVEQQCSSKGCGLIVWVCGNTK